MVSKTTPSTETQAQKSIYDAVLKTLPTQLSTVSRDKMKSTPPLPTLQEEEEEEDNKEEKGKEIKSNDDAPSDHQTTTLGSKKALHVLKSFVNKASDLENSDSSLSNIQSGDISEEFIIPTIIMELVDEPLYVNSSSSANFSRRNDGHSLDLRNTSQAASTASSVAEDTGYMSHCNRDGSSSEFMIGSITRDDMSFEELAGGSIFSKDINMMHDVNRNRLTVPGANNRMVSTPSVPSNMHQPVSLDFSDASLADLSLFSNVKD